ncbi:MAG: nucleotidyltransferase domain-containing protein [Nanoarchaeota archaeon]
MNSKLIAYALDFTSFLIQKTKYKENIKSIILFGSVARQEAGEKSDIDIFIDLVKFDKKTEDELTKILNDFLDSTKYKTYWKLLNIKSEIKQIIGELDKWPDLKPSIIANGVVLYGKYMPEVKDGKHRVFFIWENIRPNAKRVLFNKQLYGYKQNKKFYPGLMQKYNAGKLGKGCILTDLEYSNLFHQLFKKHKITVQIKKVLEYA